MARGSVPDLKQWDQRWGYVSIAAPLLVLRDAVPRRFLWSIWRSRAKPTKSPADMALLRPPMGMRSMGKGLSANFLLMMPGKLGLACEGILSPAASFVRYLKSGFVVIVNVGPGDFTDSGHFFVARGVSNDGTIQINDPYSSVNTAKTWDANAIADQSIGDVRLSCRLGAVSACVVFFWLAFTNVFVH